MPCATSDHPGWCAGPACSVVAAAVLIAVLNTDPATRPRCRPVRRSVDAATVQTDHGPLGPADRDLLAKVRQAGLWEMPPARTCSSGPVPSGSGRSGVDRRRARRPGPDRPRCGGRARCGAAEPAVRAATRLDRADRRRVGGRLRPDRDQPPAAGPRQGAAGHRPGPVRHPQRPDPQLRHHGRGVRHPPPRVPGEHRSGRLRGAPRARRANAATPPSPAAAAATGRRRSRYHRQPPNPIPSRWPTAVRPGPVAIAHPGGRLDDLVRGRRGRRGTRRRGAARADAAYRFPPGGQPLAPPGEHRPPARAVASRLRLGTTSAARRPPRGVVSAESTPAAGGLGRFAPPATGRLHRKGPAGTGQPRPTPG